MTYRSFEIYPHWLEGFVFTHEDYDGAPDANDSRTGSAKSIDACKRAIDQYYLDHTTYFVTHSKALRPIPFNYMSEAIGFCKFWGLDLNNITPSLKDNEFSFDSL